MDAHIEAMVNGAEGDTGMVEADKLDFDETAELDAYYDSLWQMERVRHGIDEEKPR